MSWMTQCWKSHPSFPQYALDYAAQHFQLGKGTPEVLTEECDYQEAGVLGGHPGGWLALIIIGYVFDSISQKIPLSGLSYMNF